MHFERLMLLFSAAIFSLGAAAGCDDSSDADGDAGDTEPDVESPLVGMDNVVAYQGVDKTFDVAITASDNVGVATVELLVDGEVAASSSADPFTISWDTTSLEAGSIVAISARASDLAGNIAETTPITVVVINGGYIIEFTDGFSGEMSIPEPYLDTEVDVKHHWNAPTAAPRILSVVLFTVPDGQPEWQLAIEIGTGICPIDGETLDAIAVNPVTAGPFVFDSEPTGGYPGGGQMFYHLRPGTPADHEGESIGYEIHAYAFE